MKGPLRTSLASQIWQSKKRDDTAFLAREHSTHAISPLKDIDWDRTNPETQVKTPLQVLTGNGENNGPASLMEIAARMAAKYVDDIDHLDELSPRTVKLIWDQLCSDQPLSLSTWLAFNRTLLIVTHEKTPPTSTGYFDAYKNPIPEDEGSDSTTACKSTFKGAISFTLSRPEMGKTDVLSSHWNTNFPDYSSIHAADLAVYFKLWASKNKMLENFQQRISVPTADLVVYLKPLAPKNELFTFITQICIAGACQIKSTELLLLTGLRNLGVLELIEPEDPEKPFPRISDRLVREWSRQENPFPELLFLKIHTRHSLTEQSLQYLASFPALAMFEIVTNEAFSSDLARSLGWLPRDDGWHTSSLRDRDRERDAEKMLQDLAKGLRYLHERGWERNRQVYHYVRDKLRRKPASPWGDRQPPVASLILGMEEKIRDPVRSYLHCKLDRMIFFRASMFDLEWKLSDSRSDGAKEVKGPSASKRGLLAPFKASPRNQRASFRAAKARRAGRNIDTLLQGFQS